jgi:integrase
MRLNEATVGSIPFGPRSRIADEGQRGLYLTIGKTSKVWEFKKRNRWTRIGSWPEWSVAAARIRARELAVQDDRGLPLALTVKAAHGLWLALPHAPLTIRNAATILRKHLGGIAETDLAKLTRPDIVHLHSQIARKSGPMAARNAMISLRAWWRQAQRLDPSLPECPVVAVNMARQGKREIGPLYENLAAWHDALTLIRSPVRRQFYLMALFTGMRRTSLMEARWDHIKDGVLHIPSPKASRGQPPSPYAIPLTDAHTAILDTLDAWRRVVAPQSPWLFPGDRRDHITDVTLTTAEAREWRARGAPSFTPHDLRAAFISAAVEAAAHPYAISLLVNHRIGGTAGYYVSKSLDLKSAMGSIASHLQARLSPVSMG